MISKIEEIEVLPSGEVLISGEWFQGGQMFCMESAIEKLQDVVPAADMVVAYDCYGEPFKSVRQGGKFLLSMKAEV